MSGRPSSSQRSPVSGEQMRPDVCERKNAIFSGVAASAAMIRSPSFSRSSSSTTTTISPLATAATASSMRARGMSAFSRFSVVQQSFDVLGDQIDFKVHTFACLPATQGGDLGGVRDDRDGEPVVGDRDDRQRAPVDRDGALLDDVAPQV